LSLVTPRIGYKSVPWYFGKEIVIPQEWEVTTLKENAHVTDGSHLTPVKVRKGFPMATVANVKNSSLDIDSCYKISEEDFKQLTKNNCKPEINDVLFTKDGTVGKSIVFTQNIDVVLLSSIAILRPFENLDSYFLHHSFHSDAITKFTVKFLGGTAIKRIILKNLENFYFPLPPLPEQQKIATILSNVDSLINSTSKVIENSKSLKTGLMQKLLTRGIGHTKFKKVQWLFGKDIEIPEEWEFKNIEDIFKLKSGSTPSRTNPEFFTGNIPWVTSTDLNRSTITSTIEKITEESITSAHLTIFPKGTFFIATYGLEASKTRGKCAIIEIDSTCNQACMAFLPSEKMITIFLFYFYLHFGEKIVFSIAQGTKQQNLYSYTVGRVRLLIPPLPEQQKIATILSNIDSKITSQVQYKEKLQKLKTSLMQKLLTGEVRV
jgi:type I restriction enzyme, S subunit